MCSKTSTFNSNNNSNGNNASSKNGEARDVQKMESFLRSMHSIQSKTGVGGGYYRRRNSICGDVVASMRRPSSSIVRDSSDSASSSGSSSSGSDGSKAGEVNNNNSNINKPESILRRPRRRNSMFCETAPFLATTMADHRRTETAEKKIGASAPLSSSTFSTSSVTAPERADPSTAFQSRIGVPPKRRSSIVTFCIDHRDVVKTDINKKNVKVDAEIQVEQKKNEPSTTATASAIATNLPLPKKKTITTTTVKTASRPRRWHSMYEIESMNDDNNTDSSSTDHPLPSRPSRRVTTTTNTNATANTNYDFKCNLLSKRYSSHDDDNQNQEDDGDEEEPKAMYQIGQTLQSPQHMIDIKFKKGMLQSISSLKINDFAFIKRSNGSFSYALLVDKVSASVSVSVEHGQQDDGREAECMMKFVTDQEGRFKIIKSLYWLDIIRPVNWSVVDDNASSSSSYPSASTAADASTTSSSSTTAASTSASSSRDFQYTINNDVNNDHKVTDIHHHVHVKKFYDTVERYERRRSISGSRVISSKNARTLKRRSSIEVMEDADTVLERIMGQQIKIY